MRSRIGFKVDPHRPYFFKSRLVSALALGSDWIGDRFFASPSLPVPWNNLKKIAVLRLDHLGDVLLALPLLKAMGEALPEIQIDIFVGPWARPLAEISGLKIGIKIFQAPWFEKRRPRNWSFRAVKELAALLKDGRYEAAVDLRGDFRHLWAMKLAGIPNRIAPNRTGLGFTLTRRVFPLRDAHEVEINYDLLAQAGLVLTEKYRYPILHPGDREYRAQAVVREKFGLSGNTIAIHATCAHPAKRWPVDHWRRLIEDLPKETDVVLIGSREEESELEKIRAVCTRKVVPLPGVLGLADLAAFLGKCRMLIGVDSGPAHIAAAMGIPVVSLYSGTNLRSQWGPRGPRVTAIQKSILCSPCERTKCPFDNECMRLISPDEVLEAVRSILP